MNLEDLVNIPAKFYRDGSIGIEYITQPHL